jgi:hypothetical protein
MKDKILYDKTISILVKAYLNDTLEHLNCTACAVGNIIAENNGYKYIKVDKSTIGFDTDFKYTWEHKINSVWYEIFRSHWQTVFSTPNRDQKIYPENYEGDAKIEIDSTGYSWQDLAKIEFAFENKHRGATKEQRMYNGLLNVVEVLGQIHEVEKETTEETKRLFVKA